MAYKLGWIPDHGDIRDHKYSLVVPQAALPSKVDLRKYCSPVYDQGSLGSCTAQAVVGALELVENKLKSNSHWETRPSRLFVYYNERFLMGTVNQDSGAYIRDGIKSLVKWGVCDESLWPHRISDFKKKPSNAAFKAAKPNTIDEYQRVPQTLPSLKTALANNLPVIYGFTVYDSFMSSKVAKSGVASMPSKKEKKQGGHAVLAVGYDDSKKMFLCRNSWSAKWGQAGYFWMPYEYLVNDDLSADFWVVKVL